jgi:hypothetical protein
MGLLSALGGIAGSFFGGPIGGTIGSALGGALESKKSVGQASSAQQQAAQGGIDEQRRQFDAVQRLMQPYTEAGTAALTQQQALLGMGSPEAQQQAISALQSGPQFQALQQQGENAILQNASATGGLRGGNVQGALAQFRPALLSSLINQQYERLGGLSTLGQNAAAGTGNAGMSTGTNVATLLGRQGQAQAGGILGQQSALTGGINQAFGAVQGAGGFGQLFGSPSSPFTGTAISGPTSMSQADYAALSGF